MSHLLFTFQDREEILKQLTCTVLGEEFEDKATTKTPIGTTTNSDEFTTNSKTTKSSIWTSNTIDIDYGVPTRHRRETEDTLSPVFTKSSLELGSDDKKTESLDLSTGKLSFIKYPLFYASKVFTW